MNFAKSMLAVAVFAASVPAVATAWSEMSRPAPIPADELLAEIVGTDPEALAARLPGDDRDALLRLLRRHRDNVSQQLHEGDYLAACLSGGRVQEACATLKRMLTILKTMVQQIDVLLGSCV